MSTTVYMKLLEQTPEKYDRGMRFITLGRIDDIKTLIAQSSVKAGSRVLEIGCGTGRLAALMSQRGCEVFGIDVSQAMLSEARKNAPEAHIAHMTATQIDELEAGRFDHIVSTLVFSELSETELDFVLRESKKLLKVGGTLIVADEMVPTSWGKRLGYYLVRWPLAALTFLLTQNTTHALRRFDQRLEQAGFRIKASRSYLWGSLCLIEAEVV